jgi:hypothetical protein
MAREYSQSGRESNGANGRHQLAGQPRIPLGARPDTAAGTSFASALRKSNWRVLRAQRAMARFSELWKML